MALKKNSVQGFANKLTYENKGLTKKMKSMKKSYDEVAKILSNKNKDTK